MTYPRATSIHIDAVYVIESLKPGDRRTGEELHDSVIGPATFTHQRLESQYFFVLDKAEFFGALSEIGRRARAGRSPILQIEVHGSTEGVELASGETVLWEELQPHLREINLASGFNLLLVLSACFGIFVTKLLAPVQEAPMWGVIGPRIAVGPDVLLAGYSDYYHELFRSWDGVKAFAALRDRNEVPGDVFEIYTAEFIFMHGFKRYLELRPAAQAVLLSALVAAGYSRDQARERLDQRTPEQEFVERYATFFMLRDLPANRKRFPLEFGDVAFVLGPNS
jgi:hypothetical protein